MTTSHEPRPGTDEEDFGQDPAAGNGGTMGDGPDHDPGATNANRASHDGAQAAGKAATSSGETAGNTENSEESDDGKDGTTPGADKKTGSSTTGSKTKEEYEATKEQRRAQEEAEASEERYKRESQAASEVRRIINLGETFSDNDLLRILGFKPESGVKPTHKQIVAANRRLTRLLHPDAKLVAGPEAEEAIKRLTAAYGYFKSLKEYDAGNKSDRPRVPKFDDFNAKKRAGSTGGGAGTPPPTGGRAPGAGSTGGGAGTPPPTGGRAPGAGSTGGGAGTPPPTGGRAPSAGSTGGGAGTPPPTGGRAPGAGSTGGGAGTPPPTGGRAPGASPNGWEAFMRSSRTAKATILGIGTFAVAEVSNLFNWPKGGFNHLTAAASAAAVSSLVYGGSRAKEWYDGKTDSEKRRIQIGAGVIGVVAVAAGIGVAYKYGLFSGKKGKSGNHVSDQASGSIGRPRSGSTTTTLGEHISTSTSTPNGSTSSTFTSTTVPSTVPRGGNGSAWTEIGSRMPSSGAGTGAGRSGGDTTKAMAEEAFKRAAKAQEHLAKLRAKKLGIKLNDEQAKKLIERRFSNLFTGKSENFNRFVNSSDKAKQAFTDFDLKQAAA